MAQERLKKTIERLRPHIERQDKARRARRPKRGEHLPDFDSLFDPTGMVNPLDSLDYTGDVVQDAAAEESEAIKRIKEEKRQLREQWRINVDTEFWIAVCFQSRAQKEEFLGKVGWTDNGDKYLDGLQVAADMGIDIEPIMLKKKAPPKIPVPLRGARIMSQRRGGDA